MPTRMGTRSQLGWLMRVIKGRKHPGMDQSGLDSGDSRGIGEKAVGGKVELPGMAHRLQWGCGKKKETIKGDS